jgi:hypothetical protein
VHKPLFADVIAIGSVEDDSSTLVRAYLDLVNLAQSDHEQLLADVSQAAGVSPEHTVISHSHTHASGWFKRDRLDFPGGEKIPAYLEEMRSKIAKAAAQAAGDMEEVFVTYASGRCDMAANRDYWDDENELYACGFNPDKPADDTVIVGRVTDQSGKHLLTLVNYACHATTLAWENTLISPDFPGAMREEVNRVSGAPCVFAQGACGDLGPRYGYVGDTRVADQNGRWLAHAALSALESMGPPARDFEYQGPVVSGATLGTWTHVPFDDRRLEQVSVVEGGVYTVDLPLKPKPDPESLREEIDDWLARKEEAEQRGDKTRARDYGARAERARRWLGRLEGLPDGDTYPFGFSVYRLGDAIWVTTGGEPYNLLQLELRERFPDHTVLVSPVSGEHSVAYLMPEERYGKGLYQEEPSILAPGCLETLIDGIAARIEELS